jgi:malonate-semialdehyde dehydrogenase (acetylating) / methylmalonate-semialdehyde dehydrogenase
MTQETLAREETKQVLPNWIGGKAEFSQSEKQLPVLSPLNSEVIAHVPLSTTQELDAAISSARSVQKEWANTPVKERVQVMYRFKHILENKITTLANIIHLENGKSIDEAKGGILKGIECIEYAASLPQISGGEALHVGRGVECKMFRKPLGVVAGVTPFNFPAMVPLWMIPLAISLGNAFILKPSEQTPLAAIELAKALKESGLPDGIFSVINGDKSIVEALCNHPHVKAVGFVGSSPVAKQVYARTTQLGKRARCMGGAKNHLTVVPDADTEMASSNIVASVTGCAGQRCMAASVLIAVGDVEPIINKVYEKMRNIIPGRDIGPVISKRARERICSYLSRCEHGGASLVLDGRETNHEGSEHGFYIGPSIIDYAKPGHEAVLDEIFGPVLTIIRVDTLEEAIAIENNSPYGNAAVIYTSSGKVADTYSKGVNSGMIGINIGVPVPREPFSFGGWNLSRFGDGDITGASAIEFWSQPQKITTKWENHQGCNWMS